MTATKGMMYRIKEHLRRQKESFTWYPDPKKRGTLGFISDCINIGLLLYMIWLIMFRWGPEIQECITLGEDYFAKLNLKQTYYPGFDLNGSNSSMPILNVSENGCRWVCEDGG